ncbi:AAA family ATPase [Caenimonas sedimenti]|uniref:AAA family ATPase n=1 Tax=Caenimonas sedimenti TaxID=2596921 RepID=A0A562ZW34_9BURK|nr:AAA family ATPase [Caenimonas sedimenti]TWO72790.1 AAA family ATPase [Caenimonas sedimenti]
MYAAYYGLKQDPFSIAPDPRLLFMSEQHREALAHLLYGVQGGGGFVLLTGEIGTGKTTVCRSFLEQVPQHCNLAYIFNPKLTVIELLETVCHEFGIEVRSRDLLPPTVKDYLDPLNAFLLATHAAGRNNVLVIDEAQNLSADVLEQLRLLTNLETSERKLLQIILIGQPELREMLARPELEQLAQRVIARYHLAALGEAETAQYIRHRLEVCGLERPLPFDRGALRRIHALAGGVPRRINLLCDRALLGAYAGGQATVTRRIADRAAAEVFPAQTRAAGPWRRTMLAAGLGLAAGAGLLAAATKVTEEPVRPAPVAVSKPAPPPPVAVTASAPAIVAAPVTVPTPPPPAPPPVLLRDEKQAWRELAQSWKADPAQGEPCAALAREQLHCFTRKLNLALIRQLGRPGIVTLDAATGKPSYAILSGLTEQSATLRAAGSEQTVTLAALAERWDGEFATLVRVPAGYRDSFTEGQAGPTVEWLAQRLAGAKGTSPRPGPQRLDVRLRADVRAFQVAQGLPADGHPGPLTFMQLNRASGVDEPRLRTEP